MIGSKVKEERLKKGLTILELAQKAGVSKASAWRVENNVPTTADVVIKVCKVLKLYKYFSDNYEFR